MRIRWHLLLLQAGSLGVISLGASVGWLVTHQLERDARHQHLMLEYQASQAAHAAFDLLQALPHLAGYPGLQPTELQALISLDVEGLRAFRDHLDGHLSSLLI